MGRVDRKQRVLTPNPENPFVKWPRLLTTVHLKKRKITPSAQSVTSQRPCDTSTLTLFNINTTVGSSGTGTQRKTAFK
ncbi:hypothetical protein CEXT_169041 [Caerostris extrusa]|uniref:Uncharacterized protein n=1 Tax=Caerostris extrusa TaxID=172846 RepID=A0AAV4XQP9_CAEEX|nr:hypothetical protein CEXT_169041 [Caerostris extrusa]